MVTDWPKQRRDDRERIAFGSAILDKALPLLPARMDTPAARVMLLAIGMQESRFTWRRQMPTGPARGFWQFEQGGGVVGVLTHPAVKDMAALIAVRRIPESTPAAVWAALEHDDLLAGAFARLLLWTDASRLPDPEQADDVELAWQYYLRVWRPGKPHHHTWVRFWMAAREAVLT